MLGVVTFLQEWVFDGNQTQYILSGNIDSRVQQVATISKAWLKNQMKVKWQTVIVLAFVSFPGEHVFLVP